MAEEMMTKAAAMRGDGQMTMVERVARAIWAKSTQLIPEGDRVPWEEVNYCFQADILDQARAAIEVMREPTSAMVEAIKPWPEHWGSFEDADPVWKVAYWADQAAAASGFTTMINAALSEADHG